METEDELAGYLAALDRDACYRVDATLKEGRLETTERVFFVGRNGSELGPLVRKRISGDSGLGGAYEEVFAAQRSGVRVPHLPRLVECHRRDGDLVVVMELVPGETLGSVVAACGSCEERLGLAARTFPDLCDAVSELHERLDPPVIHRDLTPGNVIVSAGGVTLIDLGIARSYREGAEQDTTHFGTRAYAPPEQFGFGQTCVTSDVYALGMLLFFCVTGREPTQRDRESGFRDAGLPGELRPVVRRATELDPSARYASVRELQDAFLLAMSEGRERGGDDEGVSAVAATQGSTAAPGAAVVATAAMTEKAEKTRKVPVAQGAAEIGGGTMALETQAAADTPSAATPPADTPPESFSWQDPERRPSRLGSLLSRVPRAFGLVWDVLVIGAVAVLVGACVGAFVSPTPENALWPEWYLGLSYLICLNGLFLISGYLLLDRRPLRRAIPPLARLTVRGETRAGLIAMLVLIVVWVVAAVVVTR